jgi:hypothetical protein
MTSSSRQRYYCIIHINKQCEMPGSQAAYGTNDCDSSCDSATIDGDAWAIRQQCLVPPQSPSGNQLVCFEVTTVVQR